MSASSKCLQAKKIPVLLPFLLVEKVTTQTNHKIIRQTTWFGCWGIGRSCVVFSAVCLVCSGVVFLVNESKQWGDGWMWKQCSASFSWKELSEPCEHWLTIPLTQVSPLWAKAQCPRTLECCLGRGVGPEKRLQSTVTQGAFLAEGWSSGSGTPSLGCWTQFC